MWPWSNRPLMTLSYFVNILTYDFPPHQILVMTTITANVVIAPSCCHKKTAGIIDVRTKMAVCMFRVDGWVCVICVCMRAVLLTMQAHVHENL